MYFLEELSASAVAVERILVDLADEASKAANLEMPWRPEDSWFLERGILVPSDRRLHLLAKLRITVDEALGKEPPRWLRAWAEHPSFDAPS